ncbi:MAG TPA: 23S rRNA (uracil(1939)-C(5))-methyltransferase RlmD, partial [Deltaproteobacteria bacterium]|nr:23S rRNA (uracil(1939)-C(5))-methyltransferase RlmD [Deltaproteobacteria bacterium]
VVFVRGAITGDRIACRIVKKKKAYAEALLVELLTPSPDRIEPPCPYAGYCGGCQWQHVAYEKQLAFKKDQVVDPLEHIGGFKNPPVHQVSPSEKVFGYRNKMEFSFSDRRWYLPDEMHLRENHGDFALGLHVPGAFQKVIDVEACLLQQDTGNRILRDVKRYALESGVPVYGLKSHEGFWRFLTLRYSVAMDEWMVNLITSQYRPETVQPLSEFLCGKYDRIRTVVNNINIRKASIAVGETEKTLFGDGYIEDRIGDFHFRISANSFFQTNSAGSANLYSTVAEYAGLQGGEKVLDLYSGTGTIPIFLSEKADSVTGIEISESASADAEKNARENLIKNCRFVCGDIKDALKEISFKPDVVIIDPPRAGMHKDVLSRLLEMAPEKIVYTSCNPATLARDLGQMVETYELHEVQPVDMFPNTYHIEAVARLSIRK